MRLAISLSILAIFALFQCLGVPVPDFTLTDTNPNSVRKNSAVSPRDYKLQISAYYFGHAN